MDEYNNISIIESLVTWEKLYLTRICNALEIKHLIYPKDFFDVFHCVDLIYAYHEAQFLPDLQKCNTNADVVETFIKHKFLFYLYEEFLKIESYLMHVDDFEPFNFVENLRTKSNALNILHEKLEEYLTFLEVIKVSLPSQEPSRCNVALKIIEEILEKTKLNRRQNFIICELIATERRYIFNVKKYIENLEKNIFLKHEKFFTKRRSIYGKLPEIHNHQNKFLKDLEMYLFNPDLEDVIDCFLTHKSTFEIYIEHNRLKDNKIIEAASNETNVKIGDKALERIIKYPAFFEKFKKFTSRGDRISKKIERVNKFFSRLNNEVNNILSITEIINSNVNVFGLGLLWKKGLLKVQVITNPVKYIFRKQSEIFLFLFQEALVFTVKSSNGKYGYVYHVLTKEINLVESNAKEINFSINTYFGNDNYKLYGEEQIINDWKLKINEILEEIEKE